jgi:hypothetical protein
LGVLLLDLKLCASRFSVRESVDNLALSAGELGGALEVLEGVGDLALLEKELGHGGNGDVAFGVDCGILLVKNILEISMVRALTDKSLLAQILSGGEVLLPLEESKSLVDERQNVHSSALLADDLLLHLNGSLELLDGLLVLLLVEQKLTVVVVNIALVAEVLDAAAEGGHGRGDRAHLVLCDTELDVREDELRVEVDGLLVVGGSHGELGEDEVELGAVVEDIGVLRVVLNGKLKVTSSLIAFSCGIIVSTEIEVGIQAPNILCSRCMLARLT